MKRFIKRLARSHPNAKMIHVILDNAGYCCSKELLAYCNELGNIKLDFLPYYSPNLNLIGRLWKFFKKNVIYNTYYEKFADLTQACKDFFKNIKKHKVSLRTLLAENFHIQKN
jgi:transposase